MASWRIQECGIEPVVGDLVQVTTDNGSSTHGNRGQKVEWECAHLVASAESEVSSFVIEIWGPSIKGS